MSIVDLSRVSSPSDLSVEICVIGSGCGGGTAARVLSEAGHEVLILEEGGDYTGARLTQRDAEMYDQLYMDRGGRVTEDLGISVLQGRALGGGGVINACDVVPIPAGVLAHWRRAHGLTELTPEALRPHEEAALVDLSASRIPEDEVNRANGLLRDGARALGLRGEAMMHNRVGCVGLGTCLIGCPADAKRNPRFVAIPKALAAGARVLLRARAVRIDDTWADVKRIAVRTLDEKGYRERGTFTVRAKVVIVAANAVASAQLLLRSGVGNHHVGRTLSLQPQLPVLAELDERIDPQLGIPQSWALTHFEQEDHPDHGLHGFRIEGIMGTPGIVSSMLPYIGVRGKEAMTGYTRSAGVLVLVPDAPTGSVSLTASGRPIIRYQHAEEHKARLRQGAREAARIYLAAGVRRVVVPTIPPVIIESERDLGAIDRISLEPATAPLLSAHQQGSLPMSPSQRDGALDPDGKVYGTRGVYVFDSSGFPTSASTHTMTPIITMSRWWSSRLAGTLRA